MVILRSQNKITDFFMILAWASPFNVLINHVNTVVAYFFLNQDSCIQNKMPPRRLGAIFIRARGKQPGRPIFFFYIVKYNIYEIYIVSISSLTGECVAEKFKNFCSSSL